VTLLGCLAETPVLTSDAFPTVEGRFSFDSWGGLVPSSLPLAVFQPVHVCVRSGRKGPFPEAGGRTYLLSADSALKYS